MTTWATIAAPTRGAAPDGAIAEGIGDGFYTPPSGDGVMVGDGDWTPLHLPATPTSWTSVTVPVPTGAFLADGTYLADGSIPASGGSTGWVGVNVS